MPDNRSLDILAIWMIGSKRGFFCPFKHRTLYEVGIPVFPQKSKSLIGYSA
jgi:hypothetical protein